MNIPATDYPEGEDGGRYVRGRQRRGMIGASCSLARR